MKTHAIKLLKRLAVAVLFAPTLAMAAGVTIVMDKAPVSTDPQKLQNGARTFINYCLNCHSASLVRYNQLEKIGFDKETIERELIFTGENAGSMMTVAMTPEDAETWFGKAPPDLSVTARARASETYSGADWLYTYLRGFYKDEARPTGWNNAVFNKVAMPHVMWDMQGTQTEREATRKITDKRGEHDNKIFKHNKNDTQTFELIPPSSPGSMSAKEYDDAVTDLVSFMVWMGEPVAEERKFIGIFVLIFLAGYYVLTHMLGKTYWKNIH